MHKHPPFIRVISRKNLRGDAAKLTEYIEKLRAK
jgi:hypothetical protein